MVKKGNGVVKRAVDCSSPIASSGSEGRQGGTGASPVRQSHRTVCLFCSLGIVLWGGAAEMYCESGRKGERRARRQPQSEVRFSYCTRRSRRWPDWWRGGRRRGRLSRFVPSRGQVVSEGGKGVRVQKVEVGWKRTSWRARSDDSTAGNVGRTIGNPKAVSDEALAAAATGRTVETGAKAVAEAEREGNGLSGLSGTAGQAETGGVTRTKEGKWMRRKGQEAKGGGMGWKGTRCSLRPRCPAAVPLNLLQADIGLLDVPFRGKTLRVEDGEPWHSTGKGMERSLDGRLAIRKVTGLQQSHSCKRSWGSLI